MNRYDNGSVSRFNPMSLQEIMLTPAMQRQKHDQMLAQQEALTQGLAKVNPHDKYFEEASRLKNDLNNQISNQALQLSKEGINPNSQASFLKLNREYQEMTSPTGKLGMINSHNINLQTTYKNYIDEAIKAGQPPIIAQQHAKLAMQKHMSEPLYDERGRVVDFNAGNSAPKNIDKIEWVNKLATNVGFDKKSWERASSALSTDGQNRFVVNSSANGMSKDNIEMLNRLAERLNSEVSNPMSEIRQDIDYKFQDPKTELQGMLNHLYAKRERDSDSGSSSTKSNIDWANQDNENSRGYVDAIFDPTSTKTIGSGNVSNISFDKIGTKSASGFGGGFGQNVDINRGNNKQELLTYDKMIKDPIVRRAYKLTYDKMVASGELTKTSDINSNSVAKKIEVKFKSGAVKIPTVGNDIVRTDINPSSDLFLGQMVGKTKAARDATMQSDLDGGLRTMIDPKTGDELTPQQFRDKGYKIEYVGYDDPVNARGYSFKGGNQGKQQSMAHNVNVYDDKGVSLGLGKVTRTSKEMNTPEFQKAYRITHIYRNAISNFNEWTTPNKFTDGVRVKFKDNGMFDIEVKGKEPYENLSPSDYKHVMDALITK